MYYKLHGSARPISMKSDVIRKHSRHDARRTNGPEDTPSASLAVSRHTSPVRDGSPSCSRFDDADVLRLQRGNQVPRHHLDTTSTSSELMGALGTTTDPSQPPPFNRFQLDRRTRSRRQLSYRAGWRWATQRWISTVLNAPLTNEPDSRISNRFTRTQIFRLAF